MLYVKMQLFVWSFTSTFTLISTYVICKQSLSHRLCKSCNYIHKVITSYASCRMQFVVVIIKWLIVIMYFSNVLIMIILTIRLQYCGCNYRVQLLRIYIFIFIKSIYIYILRKFAGCNVRTLKVAYKNFNLFYFE